MPDRNPFYFEGEIVPLAERSEAGDSGVLESFARFNKFKVFVQVEERPGSGNLSLFLEETFDGSHWSQIASATVGPGPPSAVVISFSPTPSGSNPIAERLRLRWAPTAGTWEFAVHLIAKA